MDSWLARSYRCSRPGMTAWDLGAQSSNANILLLRAVDAASSCCAITNNLVATHRLRGSAMFACAFAIAGIASPACSAALAVMRPGRIALRACGMMLEDAANPLRGLTFRQLPLHHLISKINNR
ncbi:hypothetical protein [Rhodopseudomonas palustris]